MNVVNARQSINESLYKNIGHLGYVYKKSAEAFVLAEKDNEYIFKLIYTKWSGYVSLSVRAYIKNKKVESLIYKITQEKSSEITVGSEIKQIANSPDGILQINDSLNILIENDVDISKTLDVLEKCFFDIAIPFYTKFGNLQMIDKLFNEPPFDYLPVFVQRTLAERCMKGLILAKLVGRRNYSELVKIFDSLILIPRGNPQLDYNLVKEYLEKHEI